MSAELEAFKRELDAAGQPWSAWGVRAVAIGLIGWMVVMVSFAAGKVAIFLTDLIPNAFFVLGGVSVAFIAAGWVLLIVAFVKRTQWRKGHAFEPGGLDETPVSAP